MRKVRTFLHQRRVPPYHRRSDGLPISKTSISRLWTVDRAGITRWTRLIPTSKADDDVREGRHEQAIILAVRSVSDIKLLTINALMSNQLLRFKPSWDNVRRRQQQS